MCVVSAVVAAMVILVASVSELMLYYMHSDWLIMWSSPNGSAASESNGSAAGNDTMSSSAFNETFAANETTIPPELLSNATKSVLEAASQGISLHDTIFLAFISVLGILAAITVGLLLHLCFFHVYISFLGLTTYEYIRNQRMNAATQASNGEAKPTPEAALSALTKSSMTQLFFCSTIDPKNLLENHSDEKYEPKAIHCCIRSPQYPRSSHKALYVCSMLHERTIDENAVEEQVAANRVFHCCSQFRQIVKLPSERSESMPSQGAPDEAVQLSEQCTFCSFKMRPAGRSAPAESERCCAKMHSKHHRWRRKWNCCSAAPDSPDEPTDVVRSLSAAVEQPRHTSHSNSHHHRHHHHHHHPRGADCADKNFAKVTNHTRASANGTTAKGSAPVVKNAGKRPSLATNLKSNSRPRLMRPLARVRHILRILSQRRRDSDCNSNSGTEYPDTVAPIAAIKINQVRPITLTEEMLHQRPVPCQPPPPSAISGSGDVIRQGVRSSLSMPALPPPTRRRIASSPDLDELAEAISFVQNTHFVQTSPTNQTAPSRAFPSINRRRRKNLLRNRSPTLSPIHESGYSNPASPQPGRHNANGVSNTSTPRSARSAAHRASNKRNY